MKKRRLTGLEALLERLDSWGVAYTVYDEAKYMHEEAVKLGATRSIDLEEQHEKA